MMLTIPSSNIFLSLESVGLQSNRLSKNSKFVREKKCYFNLKNLTLIFVHILPMLRKLILYFYNSLLFCQLHRSIMP